MRVPLNRKRLLFVPMPAKDNIRNSFRKLAERTSRVIGSPPVFFIAIFFIVAWGVSGFYFGFSDTWQLVINTGTTIVTFMIVILIQNTQNRDSKSIQLKLDELIRGTKNTRNSLMEIENQSDEELDAFKEEFKLLREKYLSKVKRTQKY